MTDDSCFDAACADRVKVRCLHCRRGGCAMHIRRYLIGGVAYMDLCAVCAREWQRRFNRTTAPAEQPARVLA